MKAEWKDITNRIKSEENIKKCDKGIEGAVSSWKQVEKEMSLILSREVGYFVKIRPSKKDDFKTLRIEKKLETVLRINGAASDLTIIVDFNKKHIQFSTLLSAIRKDNIRLKSQISPINKQINGMEKSDPKSFKLLNNRLSICLQLLNKTAENLHASKLDKFVKDNKGRTLNKYGFNLIIDIACADFAGGKKVIEEVNKYLLLYNKVVLQNLK